MNITEMPSVACLLHTIILKTASEAAMVAMETMRKAVAGGLAKLEDSPDRFASEAYHYAKGMARLWEYTSNQSLVARCS